MGCCFSCGSDDSKNHATVPVPTISGRVFEHHQNHDLTRISDESNGWVSCIRPVQVEIDYRLSPQQDIGRISGGTTVQEPGYRRVDRDDKIDPTGTRSSLEGGHVQERVAKESRACDRSRDGFSYISDYNVSFKGTEEITRQTFGEREKEEQRQRILQATNSICKPENNLLEDDVNLISFDEYWPSLGQTFGEREKEEQRQRILQARKSNSKHEGNLLKDDVDLISLDGYWSSPSRPSHASVTGEGSSACQQLNAHNPYIVSGRTDSHLVLNKIVQNVEPSGSSKEEEIAIKVLNARLAALCNGVEASKETSGARLSTVADLEIRLERLQRPLSADSEDDDDDYESGKRSSVHMRELEDRLRALGSKTVPEPCDITTLKVSDLENAKKRRESEEKHEINLARRLAKLQKPLGAGIK